MDRRENCMKDIVFSALNLLIGVVQITWMIARDVFRGRPKATAKANIIPKAKKIDRLCLPNPGGQSFDIMPVRS